GRAPSAGPPCPLRRGPRPRSWSCGCPAAPRRAGPRRPGASAGCWPARRRRRRADRPSRPFPHHPRRVRPQCSPARTTLRLGLALGGGADEDQTTGGAGDRAAHEDEVLLRVDRLDRQTLCGVAHAAHTAGHPDALEDAARGGAGADRARRTVLALDTVARPKATETVALHDT